jgi:hypothetical protein
VGAAQLVFNEAMLTVARRVRPDLDEFVAAEVESTPLVGRISEDVYGRIREDAREVLRPFTTPTGRVEIPLEGHLVAARP